MLHIGQRLWISNRRLVFLVQYRLCWAVSKIFFTVWDLNATLTTLWIIFLYSVSTTCSIYWALVHYMLYWSTGYWQFEHQNFVSSAAAVVLWWALSVWGWFPLSLLISMIFSRSLGLIIMWLVDGINSSLCL